MPKLSSSIADSYVTRLESLEFTRKRLETLFSQSRVAARDVERVYGAIFVSAVASFEALVEDLFLGLLVGRVKPRSGVHQRLSFRSEQVARQVVFGGRSYVNWFPYEQTEQRSKLFFRGGRPFTYLDPNDKSVLLKILYVRNVLAHRSGYAKKKFTTEVIGIAPLLPQEKTPTGFLRSNIRVAPPQTRYEQLAYELSRMAFKLCG